ncbi:hypothetical protein PCASD_01612 [Puccinia coronata f. sp. avenae]|uniref:Uncharacterized protein n=1 Tax=Puccinia coronata f. sp. avenae TaxID=200324 RepID=A0A2N5T9H7_9BASI|nr:hypothetical protein PCASD_12258 [Puccinia coronata f. sp. avenae]PLW49781.1 hypothetical protein PCASD_01612 [Puccinia coronata f. sp. avenae]
MNLTFCLCVKVAILLALSCQVIRADSGSSAATGEGLDSKLRRRQADVKAENGKKDTAGKEKNVSKEEQLAFKLFEGIVEMGAGLETVTNMGSTSKDVLDKSKKVSAMVTQLKSLTADLLNSAPNKTPQLSQAVEESSKAGESIAKSLVAIEAKPDDANTIKKEFRNLEKSFKQIIATSDGLVVAAIPKLAQFGGAQATQAGAQATQAGGQATQPGGQATQAGGQAAQAGGQATQAAAAPNPATKKEEEPCKKVEENNPAEVAPPAAAGVEAKRMQL